MYKGSKWQKWDLHVHTIYTNQNSHYSCTMKEMAQKIEAENLAVVGITNYFIVHEKEIEELKAELTQSVTLMPNFEFRITEKNRSNEFINVHVLFNLMNVNFQKIHDCLGRIPIANSTDKYCNKADIEELGYERVTVTLDSLINQLEKDFTAGKDFLFIGVNKGYGGFCPGGKPRDQELAAKIDKLSDIVFSSKKEDRDFFLNKIPGRKTLGLIPKPLLIASDAHKIGDIGNQFTWIKADPTFEGLKQCIFEPEHRISLNKTNLREPIRKIENIEFKFPSDTKMGKRGSSARQDLCIKFLKKKIAFSPYFTSIIGGRGTGKSTIINLLAESLGVKTEFFNKHQNQVIVNGNVLDFDQDNSSIIEISGTDEVEFVSQGKVEKLAESEELTKLIFNERIKEVEKDFGTLELKYLHHKELLEENVKLIFSIKKNYKSQKEKEKDRSTASKIVESIQDPRYKALSEEIKKLSESIRAIDKSKAKYFELLQDLKKLNSKTYKSENKNEYETRIKQILEVTNSIDEIIISDNEVTVVPKSFEEQDLKRQEFNQNLSDKQKELREFLREKGTSEESILDSEKASSDIAKLDSEISELVKEIEQAKQNLEENDIKLRDIKTNYIDIEALIAKNIESINSRLKSLNENVQEIKFEYSFNSEKYREVLFRDFFNTFKIFDLPTSPAEKLKEVLFLILPDEDLFNLDYKTFTTRLQARIKEEGLNPTRNYVQVIENVFSSKGNYHIYRELVKKHLYNFADFLEIIGFYGNRELQNCSFGQRCTAVIVTMLMTGVKPLIIDEPEAHLDNKLIADYLVELIKNKKLDRQIIFATHNSNFVVNGDSELIHILEIPDNKIHTNITSTSIENLKYRTKLLKLEGGKEAFINRENKYGIRE